MFKFIKILSNANHINEKVYNDKKYLKITFNGISVLQRRYVVRANMEINVIISKIYFLLMFIIFNAKAVGKY